jgi:hypothetical protein
MFCSLRALLPVIIAACASTVLASAQAMSSSTELDPAAPVAFAYVSSNPSSGDQISAYAVSANGALAPVAGSPFAESGLYLATSAKWLFSTDITNIYSFAIAPGGALSQVSSVDVLQYNQYDTGGAINLFTDRSGATVYDEDIYVDGSNNTYQFTAIDRQTGGLSYIGMVPTYKAVWITPLSFLADNAYAYGASCLYGSQAIYGFSRASNGILTLLSGNPTIPNLPGGTYCPYLAAADRLSDVAVTLTPENGGPAQLAVYTADSSGNLTTNSTYQNMPYALVGNVNDMKASPAGNLLAVAGSTGLQVFHFNGANPITHYTGKLITDAVNQLSWDNANHLYALSSSGELYVFDVTATNVKQAPGSPYAIPSAQYLAVAPRI